jgi:hypothetical protein
MPEIPRLARFDPFAAAGAVDEAGIDVRLQTSPEILMNPAITTLRRFQPLTLPFSQQRQLACPFVGEQATGRAVPVAARDRWPRATS